MGFESYLKNLRYTPQTIATYKRCCGYFFTWLSETGQEAEQLTYADLLGYVKYWHEKGLKQGTTNQLLRVVRQYYDYLKSIGKIETNPSNGLSVRGEKKRLPHDLLSATQLDELYEGYSQKSPAGKRNKIMLGLLAYQGISASELEILEELHLKLPEAKITIPGMTRSNRRTLKLEACQILSLQEYVSGTRGKLLAMSGKESVKLFVSSGSSESLQNSISKLMAKLRKENKHFLNAQQLRQSRLAIWVKQYGIRQAQYMAGHKYVSSTERYQSTDLEALREELAKHHPLQ